MTDEYKLALHRLMHVLRTESTILEVNGIAHYVIAVDKVLQATSEGSPETTGEKGAPPSLWDDRDYDEWRTR